MPSASVPTPLSRSASPSSVSPGLVTWLCATAMIVIQVYIVFIAYDFEGPKWLAHFADDLLYYVVPAQNFVETGRSSFDGITLTNGYHPLWFVVNAALALVFDPTKGAYFAAVLAISSGLCLMGMAGVRQLLRAAAPRVTFVETISFLYFASAFLISRDGMETALVVGLVPWWLVMAVHLWRRPADNAVLFGFGLLGSLVVLSRLDTVTLALPVGAALVLNWWRRTDGIEAIRRALVTTSGTFLLPIYLGLNQFVFGTWLPVSGMSKGLVTEPGFAFWVIDQLFLHGLRTGERFPFWPSVGAVAALALLTKPPVRRKVHPVLVASLVFPFLFYFVTAARSDWPMWSWYFFPIVIALPATMVVLAAAWPMRRMAGPWMARLDVVCVLLLLAIHVPERLRQADALPPAMDSLFLAPYDLEAFAARHPGVYAMGDRAGKVGLLFSQMDRPLIQLEGLAADRAMVEAIAAEEDLLDVLHRYDVDYYIGTDLAMDEDGCWQATEPANLPGARVPRMRTLLCDNPVLNMTHTGADGSFSTQIFRVTRTEYPDEEPLVDSGPVTEDETVEDLIGPEAAAEAEAG
ncbi:hypothetical protein [Marinivivus vitaminiproducens]|uniref:hypothetical protein n=1 Tax=Marinivivus vitaminiproducens TaxID=3035935 RepID=UPI0027A67F68|nr:hypothetical protein P4R82_12655 [Geminicoccaceae bacterium SCSIO 64248]